MLIERDGIFSIVMKTGLPNVQADAANRGTPVQSPPNGRPRLFRQRARQGHVVGVVVVPKGLLHQGQQFQVGAVGILRGTQAFGLTCDVASSTPNTVTA